MRTTDRAGFVYVIQDESGLCKIGRTRDVSKRIRSLSTGCSSELKLVASWPCRDAGEYESILHETWRDVRVRGEWFALTDEDLRSLRAFSTWLLQYVGDDSIVGDLADDWQRDPLREPECWQDLRHALGCRGVHNDVLVAARAAWHEFTRGVPTKIVAEQRAYAARIKAGIYPRTTGCFWLKDGMHSPELDRLRALRKAQEGGK